MPASELSKAKRAKVELWIKTQHNKARTKRKTRRKMRYVYLRIQESRFD
jgi:hypothetical protein